MLHAVGAIAENVEGEERVCLPILFRGLAALPLQHEKVVASALNLIGKSLLIVSEFCLVTRFIRQFNLRARLLRGVD